MINSKAKFRLMPKVAAAEGQVLIQWFEFLP